MFIDVNGLKETNDNFGHTAGDELIVNVFKAASKIFNKAPKYRIGGDEFIIFCTSINKDEFLFNVSKLKEILKSSLNPLAAVGQSWTCKLEKIDNLIKIAEKDMYIDKKNYRHHKSKE